MARENQGLQIALIIFVMLTIVLGVTTFLFFRQFEEAEIKTKASREEADVQRKDAANTKAETTELKRLMGFAATENLDKIHEGFGSDMTTYAGTFPEENRFYRPVLKFIAKTVDTRNAELAAAKEEIQTLKNKYEVRESTKDPQIKEHQEMAAKAMKEKDAVTANFNSRRDATLAEQKDLADQLKRAREEGKAALVKVESKLEDTNNRLQQLAQLNKKQSGKLRDLTNDKVDVPEGEIRWVNQRNGTVWINLGRADSLGRQTSFAVYPSDITNTAKATKKASIEVTQILGEHLAEARVVDDQIADPIMPGDKIHTPVWNPGEQKRFALAGFMDVNGDGKNDQQLVCDLITSNGGVVDCQPDLRNPGKRIGEMTVLTRYLVLGEPPNEKGQADQMQIWTRMLVDADRLGIQKVTLSDLLQRMGWKSETKVVRFGRGANPNDFKAKPDDGVPKKSTGNVFKPRQPPPVKSNSAY